MGESMGMEINREFFREIRIRAFERVETIRNDQPALADWLASIGLADEAVFFADSDAESADFRALPRTLRRQLYAAFLAAWIHSDDAKQVEVSTLSSFVEHYLTLDEDEETQKHAGTIPIRVWLNDVFWFRVNSENVRPCRPALAAALLPRLRGLDLTAKIIETNIWCAEQVTYAATDARTLDPEALLCRAFGRCGEESVLLVSALRSIGIPARQIYVPLWSHCDDNHAWVEAWSGEDYAFLGACEPEEKLNRGWFADASSRAPLLMARAASPPVKEALLDPVATTLDFSSAERRAESAAPPRIEPSAAEKSALFLINRSAFYTSTRHLCFCVSEGGRPAAYADLTLCLLNSAALLPLARLTCDADGGAEIDCGQCSLLVTARSTDGYGEYWIDGAILSDQTCSIELGAPEKWLNGETRRAWHTAPAGSAFHCVLTGKEKRWRETVRENAVLRLTEKTASWGTRAEIERLADRVPKLSAWLRERLCARLAAAHGHLLTLADFIEKAVRQGRGGEAALLLCALSEKDMVDVSEDVLADCLETSQTVEKILALGEDWELISALCSPRVAYEPLQPYRKMLLALLPEKEREGLADDPDRLQKWLDTHFEEEPGPLRRNYALSPAVALRRRKICAADRQIMLVVLLRALGVPARYNYACGSAEAWISGQWGNPWIANGEENGAEDNEVKVTGDAVLTLLPVSPASKETVWLYESNWSLARFDGRTNYLCFDEEDSRPQLPLTRTLRPGRYEVIACSRLPNGDQKSYHRRFELRAGDRREMSLSCPEIPLEEMLTSIPVDPFEVRDLAGRAIGDLLAVLNGEDSAERGAGELQLLFWLSPREEPSLHILNELLEQAERLRAMRLNGALILGTVEDQSLLSVAKVVSELPRFRLFQGEPTESAGRSLFIDPESRPRALLLTGRNSRYAVAGYQAGSVNLMVSLAGLLRR